MVKRRRPRKRLGFTPTEIISFVGGGRSGSGALALDGEQIAHLERQREGLDAAIVGLRAVQDEFAGL